MTTITKYSEHFKLVKENNSDKYYMTLSLEAPKELTKFVYKLYRNSFNGSFLNPWIMDVIHNAFSDLEETDIDNITVETDIYYSDLYKWLSLYGTAFAIKYCDEFMDEMGQQDNMNSIVSGGQWLAKDRIYQAVNNFINEQGEVN